MDRYEISEEDLSHISFPFQQGVAAPDELFEEAEELSEAPSAITAGAWTPRRLTHADIVDLHNSVIVLVPIPTNAEVTATRQTVTDGVSGAHHPIHLLIDEHSGQSYLVDGGPAWFAHFNHDLRFDAADTETVMEKTMPCTGKEARDAALSLALKNLDAFHSRHRLLPHEYIKHALYLLDVVYKRKIKRWAAVVFNKEEKPLIPNRHYARYTQFLAKAHILDNTVEKERLDFFLDKADEEAARCRRRDPGTTRIPLFGWTLFKFVTESGGKGGVLSCSEAVWAAVARAVGRGTGFYDESDSELLSPESPTVEEIIRVYVRARRLEKAAREKAALEKKNEKERAKVNGTGNAEGQEDPAAHHDATNTESQPAAGTGAGAASSAAPNSGGSPTNTEPGAAATGQPTAEPGQRGAEGGMNLETAETQPDVANAPSALGADIGVEDPGVRQSFPGPSLATLIEAGVISLAATGEANSTPGAEQNDAGAALGTGTVPTLNDVLRAADVTTSLDATALANAVANSLADVGVAGGRPSLNDANFEEGQRQSIHLATLLERDNPLFAALVETDAFKALKTMTERGDPGGEPVCDDLDCCSVCANLNMAPVLCRACGNACCLQCVIQQGQKKGGDTDSVECLHGCRGTLATLDELKAALEGGGPWRWHASVVRTSLKRKAQVAGLEEANTGLEETVRMLKARVVELGGSSDDDEGVAPPRSNIPSIP